MTMSHVTAFTYKDQAVTGVSMYYIESYHIKMSHNSFRHIKLTKALVNLVPMQQSAEQTKIFHFT